MTVLSPLAKVRPQYLKARTLLQPWRFLSAILLFLACHFTHGQSVQSALDIARITNGIVVTWPASLTEFTLEYANSFGSTTWVPITTGINIVGSNKSFTDTAAPASGRYYRLSRPAGLQGEYFNNKDLLGAPTLSRTDPNINFSWGASAPHSSLPTNLFSVRWSGLIQPEHTGPFTFFTTTDDGARLWIEGNKVIDDWVAPSLSERTSTSINLNAGQKYNIVLEHFDSSGNSSAVLKWVGPGISKSVVPSSALYFQGGAGIPPIPENLVATPISPTQINIDWTDNASNEDGFKIERRISGGTFGSPIIVAANTTHYESTGLLPGTTYVHRIYAFNKARESDYTPDARASTPQLPPPDAVSNFVGLPAAGGGMNLTWTDNATNEASYKIQRRVSGGTFGSASILGADVTNFSDTGLTSGLVYIYQVWASNSGGDSAVLELRVTAGPPVAPTSLNATLATSTSVSLQWTDSSDNEAGFDLERRVSGDPTFTRIQRPLRNITTYTDSITSGVTYIYRIRAYNSAGDSAYSPEVRITASTPAAVTNLVGAVINATTIRLDWSEASDNETGFRIERRLSGTSTWLLLTNTGPNVLTHQDSALTTDSVYIYNITAFNGAGLSTVTSLRIRAGVPEAPSNVSVVANSSSTTTINWTDSCTNEIQMKVDRVNPDGTITRVADLPAGTTTVTDQNLMSRAVYIYRVKASNVVGNSAFSNDASVTMPAPPTNPNIPYLNVTAGVVYTKAFPGFMDIEIYQQNGRYYVRDKITASQYTDSRPRRYYYVDMENVGPSLEQGYPLPERGGIYQIICKRWSNGIDQWHRPNQEAAMIWVIKPGPLGVAGETYIPSSFTFDTNDWRDQHHLRLPAFAPIAGKASPTYRYNVDQTWEDILNHGASHTAMGLGPGGYPKMLQTEGNPFNQMGEQGFVNLTQQQIKTYAAGMAPGGFLFTDYEKQAGQEGTNTYWSIDLPDDRILQNYYVWFEELNRLVPARKSGDYYRPLHWTNAFYQEGVATPLHSDFTSRAANAQSGIMPAYRNFIHTDGQIRSLRSVVKAYDVDWYLKENIYPDRRRAAHYQVYSTLFDTLNTKAAVPADATLIGFCWWGTDGDIPYKQYLRQNGGWISYYGRIQQSAWWIMTATYMGHLFGDGFHLWHDAGPETNDRTQMASDYGMGPTVWEPDVAGTPNPAQLGVNGPLYPREPRFNVQYSKLAEFRLKQYESFLTKPRSVGKYSLNGGNSWVSPSGNERADLLQKAESANPICFKWEDGDQVMVFLSWPFATQPEWNIRLEISPGVTRDVTMHKQWPMLRVFSKSNPNFGL